MAYEGFNNTKHKLKFIWDKTEDNKTTVENLEKQSLQNSSNSIFTQNLKKYTIVEINNGILAERNTHYNIEIDISDFPLSILPFLYILDEKHETNLSFTKTRIPHYIRINSNGKYILEADIIAFGTAYVKRTINLYISNPNKIINIQKYRV